MKTTDNQKEIFALVNQKNKIIGQATRKICHRNKDLIHRAFQLYLFNKKGQVLLQKRSQTKDTYPDRWTASCSGHLKLKENYKEAVLRETEEELGIKIREKDLRFIKIFFVRMPFETEFNALFFTTFNNQCVNFAKKEIAKIKWFDLNDLFEKVDFKKIKLTFCANYFLNNKKIRKLMSQYVKKNK